MYIRMYVCMYLISGMYMYECMRACMHAWMDGCMDGWMDGCIATVEYNTINFSNSQSSWVYSSVDHVDNPSLLYPL